MPIFLGASVYPVLLKITSMQNYPVKIQSYCKVCNPTSLERGNSARHSNTAACDVRGDSVKTRPSGGLKRKYRQQTDTLRVPTRLEEKNFRSFPVQFQNFPGAFGHSSQPNIKHIWTAIVTKRLPNIIECNQCQYLL